MTELALWSLVVLVDYAYAGYPCLLAVAASIQRRKIKFAPIEPTVTVIIAAFNEEMAIARKLEMVLALDYPAGRRQIIVASDCSTDRTHDIVKEFAARGVELVVLPTRAGKTAAQNLAVLHARGDILVFTDATTELAPDAIGRLVEPFADPRVGCAGARLEYRSAGGTAVGRGGGLYWRYEKLLKELESRARSLIGVSGCLYAVRRELYIPIAPDLISDLVIALDIYSGGHVSIYVPGAIAFEQTHEHAGREFSMRARVVVRSIHALVRRTQLLNPLRTGFFALQLWSHKVLRYLVPELLLGVLLSSAWLATQAMPRAPFYQGFAVLQLVGYVAVPALYVLCRRFGIRTGLLSAPFYFVLANAAALWGLVSYLRGVRDVTWTTVR
jgi:cellulose synthase/poly-beta-1,6-N-acetylglucosamine synthase-like glycosyltransferase